MKHQTTYTPCFSSSMSWSMNKKGATEGGDRKLELRRKKKEEGATGRRWKIADKTTQFLMHIKWLQWPPLLPLSATIFHWKAVPKYSSETNSEALFLFPPSSCFPTVVVVVKYCGRIFKIKLFFFFFCRRQQFFSFRFLHVSHYCYKFFFKWNLTNPVKRNVTFRLVLSLQEASFKK